MLEETTTETRMMEDNEGVPYYIHIQYDGWGNPLRRQVSRFDEPSNSIDWLY